MTISTDKKLVDIKFKDFFLGIMILQTQGLE
jgi:hypothetical protein